MREGAYKCLPTFLHMIFWAFRTIMHIDPFLLVRWSDRGSSKNRASAPTFMHIGLFWLGTGGVQLMDWAIGIGVARAYFSPHFWGSFGGPDVVVWMAKSW